jgi:putative hydrolase of the HAD superfamily
MIKIISFDLDGTLVRNTYADSVWLEGFPKLYAKEKSITIKQAKELLFKEYEKVGKDNKEWYDIDWWFKKFKINEDWRNLLNSYRSVIEIYPETKTILSDLSKRYDLIIISNAKREFIDIQLEETEIKSYFKYIFSSLTDFDAVKKIPNVYKQICKKIRIHPQEIIHIGDNKEFDFISPQKIGIKSYYLNREKTEHGNHILYTLSDFEKLGF